MFFPQTDPEERLSQCSASLQALLALSPTTLHALSKLVNNVEISDDIIGVMRNVVAQYPSKGNAIEAKAIFNDLDHGHSHAHGHVRGHMRGHAHDHTQDVVEPSVEVPLSVRLWRVSGCHELLASLGFDLMEVGQDQVTLRTGKQANRRTCQFVLQALLALFDTQEAPKSLGIDSSSSCESLNDDVRSEVAATNAASPVAGTSSNLQQRSVSPVGTVKSLNLKMPRPPLPTHRAPLLGRGSAFISYVRKRGEPDGGRVEPPTIAQPLLNSVDSTTSLNNTTDSEFSDGYSSQTMNKFEPKPKMGFSSLRTPIKVGRPGGGGESDAAFTPSPPVTLQTIDSNVSLALAHQTRIRNLYSATSSLNDGHMGEMQSTNCQRPDSSSSAASSTKDWEASAHATVLRRGPHHQMQQILPPMPPPRNNLPLVDSLRPLAPSAPIYHNPKKMNLAVNTSSIICTTAIESTSSDSEFDRFDSNDRVPPAHKPVTQQPFITPKMCEEIILMDRLSVRTEYNIPAITASVRKPSTTIVEDDETVLPFKFNANNLYFAPTDSDTNHGSDAMATNNDKTLPKANAKDHKVLMKAHNKNIPDSILRHREMTPTISEVYHERNLGLGLAPPLSKLLLSKNYEENDAKPTANITETVAEINPSAALFAGDLANSQRCISCNAINDCACKLGTKKSISSSSSSTKSWLSLASSNKLPKNDSAECNEMIEMQTKCSPNGSSNTSGTGNDADAVVVNGKLETTITSMTPKRSNSPFSDLSRRDEGDGRSVADSQCSGSYKVVDLTATTAKVSDIQERINKFNMNAKSTT